MKNQQQAAARELYFNTNLSKTEIAEKLNVTRRSIYQWSINGDWDHLRQSARHMPAILAEKCYYLLGHISDQLLSQDNFEPITPAQVNMLHKLTLTVRNLKRGTTVADNMETFNFLLERIAHRDPELAEKVMPHVEDYITDRRGKTEHDFLLDGFDEHGHLVTPDNNLEHQLDAEEALAIFTEKQQQQTTTSAAVGHSELVEEPAKEATNTNSSHPQTNTSNTSSVPSAIKASTKADLAAAASLTEVPFPRPLRAQEPIRPVHTPLRRIKDHLAA